MEARAKARYVRVTPRKARRVVDLIRGMPADQAQATLAFAPQSASDPIGKVLASAIANAGHNSHLDTRSLVVSRAWVDEGPTLKRFRDAYWNPEDERIFTDKVVGIGWAVNFSQVVARFRDGYERLTDHS